MDLIKTPFNGIPEDKKTGMSMTSEGDIIEACFLCQVYSNPVFRRMKARQFSPGLLTGAGD